MQGCRTHPPLTKDTVGEAHTRASYMESRGLILKRINFSSQITAEDFGRAHSELCPCLWMDLDNSLAKSRKKENKRVFRICSSTRLSPPVFHLPSGSSETGICGRF